MLCPFCQSLNVCVVDSRLRDGGTTVWRRRECLSCKKRFTSREKVDLGYLTVIKRNGGKEPFSREKIIMSIVKSFGKRPLPEEKVKGATDTIVDSIHKLGKKEIKTTTIGEMVLKELYKLDQVAYIRFASVFRNFKTLDEFQKDLRNLERKWKNDTRI